MPWSADENRDWLLDHVYSGDRVLDVGAGAGIWAELLREQRRVPRRNVHAVEIFEPYLDRFDLRNKYGKIYLGDFMNLSIPHGVYNVLILGDVLEHFEMGDALKVWEKARRIVGPNGYVLLSTPIVEWPQGEEEGNIHESHLSFFDMEALKALSGVVKHQEGELIGSVIAKGLERPVAADLTVLITTIPTRGDRLAVALNSVAEQSMIPAELVVQLDENRLGAPGNRDAGLDRVTTKYVAILDDDDRMYPHHLETLYKAALDTDADIVYSWFDVEGGEDPFPQNFGKPWNPEEPIQTTVTVLAKAQVIRDAGGYSNTSGISEEELRQFSQGNTVGEDFRMVCNANANGAKIVHVPNRTWAYVHWTGNTSGRPDRW